MEFPDEYDQEEPPSPSDISVRAPAVQVDVHVSDVTLESVIGMDRDGASSLTTLGDKVAQLLVERVVAEHGGDYWGSLQRRIAGVRDEEIRVQVQPIIAAQLAREFQKTNQYGEPTAGTTNLTEIIMAEVKKVLSRPLDSGSSYRGDHKTVLQKMVADAVQKEFQVVVAEQVKAVKDEIAAVAAETVKTAVLAALRK